VFSPYTPIPTNILFFDRTGPTEGVWYYEQPLPEGRKNYTKTQPIQFSEFAACLTWWNNRQENEHSWNVSAADIAAGGYNLDRKNPRSKEDSTQSTPEEIVEDILNKERMMAEIMANIKALLVNGRK
jgi:type I restriction enzyme M protein